MEIHIAKEEPPFNVLEWLYVSSYDSKHRKTKRERVKRSCAWLFDRQEYKNWYHENGTDRVLWCHGKPGAGKTFVAYGTAFRSRKQD